MALKFACPGCGKVFSRDNSVAGKRARCTACGQMFRVPFPGDGAQGGPASMPSMAPAAPEHAAYAYDLDEEPAPTPVKALKPVSAPAPTSRSNYVAKPAPKAGAPRKAPSEGTFAESVVDFLRGWLVRRAIVVGIALVGLAIWYGVLKKGDEPGTVDDAALQNDAPPMDQDPGTALPLRLIPRTFVDLNIQAGFPTDVARNDRTMKTPGGDVSARGLMSEDGEHRQFAVMLSDLPPGTPAEVSEAMLLDTGATSFRSSGPFECTNERALEVDGHPAREYEVETKAPNPKTNSKDKGVVRMFVAGDRLYQLYAIGPAEKLSKANAAMFFGSFSFLTPVRPRDGSVSVQAEAEGGEPNLAGRPAVLLPSPAATEHPPGIGGAFGGDAQAVRPLDGSLVRASLGGFRWVDSEADRVGGGAGNMRPDGQKDEHFQAIVDLPDGATLESLTLTQGERNRWVTEVSNQFWPLAVLEREHALNPAPAPSLGAQSGRHTFDLFGNGTFGIDHGSVFHLACVFQVGGKRYEVGGDCRRP